MKAIIEKSCVESRRAVAVVLDGGIHKNGKVHRGSGSRKQSGKGHAKGEENAEEMKEYLGKLQELVPFMPKNKRLSKLEVISHVIDYIHDLRETLGLPPCQQQTEMDFEMGNGEDDTHPRNFHCTTPSTRTDPLSNQTFKVSVVSDSSSGSDHDEHSDKSTSSSPPVVPSRLPLSSISSPRNTETVFSDNSSN